MATVINVQPIRSNVLKVTVPLASLRYQPNEGSNIIFLLPKGSVVVKMQYKTPCTAWIPVELAEWGIKGFISMKEVAQWSPNSKKIIV